MTTAAPAGTDLEALAERTLEWFRKEAPGAEAEVFLSRGRDRGIELRDGRLETLHETFEEGAGVRVLRDGRMGFAFCVGLEPESLKDTCRRVLEQLRHLPPDEHRILPAPSSLEAPAQASLGLTDASLFEKPLQDQLPVLRELEASVLRADRRVRRVLRAGYGESRGEVAVFSSRGIRAHEDGTQCAVSVSATAERDGEVQVGSAGASGRSYDALDFSRLAGEAAFRAASLLGGRKLPTGRRAVLFDPWISGELLELVGGLLSADEVQRGKSLLRGKRGKSVGSKLVTFVDDPWRVGGVGTSLYDAEGVPTRPKTLIEAGVLRDYFYDTYTARKEGVASNGSAGRSSFKGLPGPSSSNFSLRPGAFSREALLRDTADGILVLEIMGMHTADPVSGEFSVGVSGLAVEKGELAGAIRGAMLSGNLLELLSRVDGVADDLVFYGSLAAPTFRVADMTVA